MLFTSYGFLGFAAVLLLLYYLLPKRHQWKLLLAASLVFYLLGGAWAIVYILATAVSVWYAALRIQANAAQQSAYLQAHKDTLDREGKKAYRAQQKRIRRRWLTGCLLLDLGILAVVKYTDFAIANVNAVLGLFSKGPLPLLHILLPLGISFYTFQAVGYLIDVYRGSQPAERSLPRFLLFVSFFPLVIQGPISRFGQLSETLYAGHPYDGGTVARGLQRMLWGYFKKLVVADRIVSAVTVILGDVNAYHGAYALVGMVFYTVQLYADFTGGIDITIGLSEALGVTVQENFIRPYFSKSLKEYWRRWHISMCSWFRDYVFYPVSSSKAMQRFARFSRSRFGEAVGRRLPVYVSSFVVWFATGIWHGASWNFIVWGLLNWAILMISEELEPLYARFHAKHPGAGGLGWRLFAVGRTFLLICCLNLFDCFANIGDTLFMLGSVLTARNWGILWNGALLELGLTGVDYAVLAGAVALMLTVSLLGRRGSVRAQIAKRPYAVRFIVWYGLFLLVLLMGAYGIGYDASQFIYNRF